MLWASRRLPALACCLLPNALAEGHGPRCLDGVALLQLDVAAQQEADRLRPWQQHDRRSRVEPLALHALEPAALALNTTAIANTIFAKSRDPFSTMMQFLGALFSAVRKETFMKAVYDLSRATQKTIVEFKERSTQLGADFDLALQGELSEDQLVRLTGEYFLKETRLMNAYYEKRSAINKRTTRAMPPEVADSLSNVLATVTSPEVIAATKSLDLNLEVGVHGFCHEANVLVTNITQMEKGMSEVKRMINGTHKMEPVIKNYLNTMKPELVPRIVWVLNQFLDMEWSGADAVDNINKAVQLHMDPVLGERLKCKPSESAAARGLGLGLLAGLALAAQALSLLEGGLLGS